MSNELSPVARVETGKGHSSVYEEVSKPTIAVEKVDYSGAHEKTDPKEIALVKKLDRWIMPMLWSMYWLNYLDRNAIALARLNDLEEDLNLTSTRKLYFPTLASQFLNLITIQLFRIPNMRLHPLLRLPYRWHSFQHVLDPHTPFSLHGYHDDALGCCQRPYCHVQGLHWAPTYAILLGSH